MGACYRRGSTGGLGLGLHLGDAIELNEELPQVGNDQRGAVVVAYDVATMAGGAAATAWKYTRSTAS